MATVQQAPVASLTRQRASRAYIVGMPIASAGLWMALLTPALVVLAIKIAEITGPETRAGALSLMAGVGAIIALLANPLFDNAFQMAVVPGIIGVALAIGFAFMFKDRVRTEKPASRLTVKEFLGSFYFNPAQYPGLGWAWFTKFLVFVAYCCALLYLPYFFGDYLKVPDDQIAGLVFQATLASSVGTIVTSILGGWISDRTGKCKALVVTSAAIIMVGLTVIALSGGTGQVMLGQAIVGIGLGCFSAVDVALITDLLLADQTDNAKTFGVFNIAQALPQSLVPAVAAPVIAAAGYPGLFLAGAAVGIIGAILVTRIRGVG